MVPSPPLYTAPLLKFNSILLIEWNLPSIFFAVLLEPVFAVSSENFKACLDKFSSNSKLSAPFFCLIKLIVYNSLSLTFSKLNNSLQLLSLIGKGGKICSLNVVSILKLPPGK